MIKQKYQKIIIPTLSVLLTSCGGGGSGGNVPTQSPVPSNNKESSLTTPAYSDKSTETTPPNNAFQSIAEIAVNWDLSMPAPSDISEQKNRQIPNSNSRLNNTHSSSLSQQNFSIHHIKTDNSPINLNTQTEYIDDENTVKDVAIIDVNYHLSDYFKRKDGTYRLVLNYTPTTLGNDDQSHGTHVSSVIVRYNKTATLYGYHDLIGRFGELRINSKYYDDAHNKGVRIFNNSYASNHLNEQQVAYPVGNIPKYAKEDSIFIWAAGNYKEDRASGESRYPTVNDDVRNGWIAVTEADYSKGIAGTTNRKDYTSEQAANYIGETAKNWGIAAQGEYQFILPYKDGKKVYFPIHGTSFSTPRVTAAAANVWTKFPWMDNHLVVVSLLSTADKPGTFLKGQDGVCETLGAKECGEPTMAPDNKFGWGLLNERRALKGPARFDKRLLTNKDAISGGDDGKFTQNSANSNKALNNDLLVVNFDFRHYNDKEKLTWRNNIQGDAGILKQGSGTLYLTGKNTYQGKTIVDGGTLGIGHSLTSNVIINQGGTLLAEFDAQKYPQNDKKVTLGKDEHHTDYTVKNNGSLNVYGAGLKIQGNYQGGADSRIVIDIDKSSLDVTGTMDLGDKSKIVADVKDLTQHGVPSQMEQERTIISAKAITNHGNISYAKSNKINNYIEISKFAIENNKDIKVKYKRNSTAYVLETINYTPKSALQTAQNLDKALDQLSSEKRTHGIRLQAASLFSADKAELISMIDSLSGEVYASSQAVLINQNLIANQMLSQRVMSVNKGEKQGVWLDGIYANSKIHQTGYARAKVKTTGTQFGVDHKLNNNLTLGIAVNQSQANANFNREAGSNKTKTLGSFLYGAYQSEYAYLASIAGINRVHSQVNRLVLNTPTQAAWRSNIYNLYTELGTQLSIGKINLNPFVAHSFNQIQRGAFKEPVQFGIDAKAKKYAIHTTILGLRTEMKFDKLALHSHLSHAYTPNKNHFGFEAKFTGFDDSIHITGAEQNQHMTWLGFGADYEFAQGLRLQFSYHLSSREGKKENDAFNLGLMYRF